MKEIKSWGQRSKCSTFIRLFLVINCFRIVRNFHISRQQISLAQMNLAGPLITKREHTFGNQFYRLAFIIFLNARHFVRIEK